MPRNHPFYIVAPAYDSASAGNRTLYTLAEQLERLGYEAFVAMRDGSDPVVRQTQDGHFVRYLDPEMAECHYRSGLTPITIYPEITEYLSPAGIRVFYMLNYVGLLGGPSRIPDCDYVLSYSQNLATSAERCDRVLYIPVSDPDYWCLDPESPRDIMTVYAGKYVDHHGQVIPPHLADAVQITRHGPDAPTRDQLRALLQRSRCLHIFENTAVATEALLCGCPVVYHLNPFFIELIAEHELSMAGVTAYDDATSIAKASAGVRQFQHIYRHAQAGIVKNVAQMAIELQRLARSKPYVDRFR